ncbi:MAG: glycoside hydrolase family 30 protein [Bacteroidota bacterium]
MKKIASSILLLTSLTVIAQSPKTNPFVFKGTAVVYTTADKTAMRNTETSRPVFAPLAQPLETNPCVFVDPSQTFQEFVGIGGAITDAAAETFAKLKPEAQEEFLSAYFNPDKGIGYTLARTNIHSCDFSSGSYTYVADNDKELKTFSVAHDEQYRIPLIKKAISAAGGKLTLYASPWSPPAWMKDNNSMLQGGKLRPEFRQAWANYYVKFIRTYEKMGMPIWGLTVQNEPMAKQRWESCIFTAEDERDFIKGYLGPTLLKEGLSSKKLVAWDHNRDLIFQRASVLLNDPVAAKFIWGIGFHWYETWTGGGMQFGNVKKVQESFPDKKLLFTEGCQEKFNWNRMEDWALGEKYGLSMVNDFNSGTVAWTDWNILLDEKGGPNHVGNFCFAPLHADTKTGQLVYTNAFYYIGHFSKFIRPGAKRINSSSSRDQLQTTAFLNTDGSIAVVVLNTTDQNIPFNIWIKGKAAPVVSLPHSINTVIIR